MTENEIKKILELAEIHEKISPEFSCYLCKKRLNINICDNCTLYGENFVNDLI